MEPGEYDIHAKQKQKLILEENPIQLHPDAKYLKQYEMSLLAEGTVNLINLIVDKEFDTIFFLDKSARQAAYLTHQTWKRIYPTADFPQIRFVNVGRSDTFSAYSDLTEEMIADIRKYEDYNGQKILIADEYVSGGTSLYGAQNVILRAFPHVAQVDYTSIYKNPPLWLSNRGTHAVQDPKPDSETQNRLRIEKADQYVFNPFIAERVSDETRDISVLNKHRAELDILAEQIGHNVHSQPLGTEHIQPQIIDRLLKGLRKDEAALLKHDQH
ncbi:hypothetical protein BH09PAT2_BH09PAT2_10300 [soil metagenome]